MGVNPPSLKVLAVFNVFPQYRRAVVEHLWESAQHDYCIAAGFESALPALKLVVLDELQRRIQQGRFRVVENRWFGPNWLWQKKVSWPSYMAGYDVIIHTGSIYQLSTWFAAIAARLSGKRFLMWTHGMTNREAGIKDWLRRCFYRLADGCLLYGHRARSLMIDAGFDAERLYVIYNSLDYSTQAAMREQITVEEIAKAKAALFAEPSLPGLIYVGRLVQEKRPALLLDAVITLREQGVRVNLVFVGDGPQRDQLLEIINQHGLVDQVALYGASHDEKTLAPLLMASDIAIMPSALGLAAMHYMAYGLSVVTDDDMARHGPEVEAIVDGINGAFYRAGDSQSLAETIHQLLLTNKRTKSTAIDIIEKYYNPAVQCSIIDYACAGNPASAQPCALPPHRLSGCHKNES